MNTPALCGQHVRYCSRARPIVKRSRILSAGPVARLLSLPMEIYSRSIKVRAVGPRRRISLPSNPASAARIPLKDAAR